MKSINHWAKPILTSITCGALLACGGGGSGEAPVDVVLRTSVETPGANCAEGGNKLRYGVDKNQDGNLQDDEVQGVAFACQNAVNLAGIEIIPLEPGDARCPAGGNILRVTGAAGATGAQDVLACGATVSQSGEAGAAGTPGAAGAPGAAGPAGVVGATGAAGAVGPAGPAGPAGATGPAGPAGATGAAGPAGAAGSPGPAGATGATGATGAAGATGATGAAAPDLSLGRFIPTQLVAGAVLTCATTSETATVTNCQGLLVNGMQVRLAPAEANAICRTITGKGYNSANGAATIGPLYMAWSVSAWALQDGTVAPLNSLYCNR